MEPQMPGQTQRNEKIHRACHCLLVILMSAQEVEARGRGRINNQPANEWLPLAAKFALRTCVVRARNGARVHSDCCCTRVFPSKPTK